MQPDHVRHVQRRAFGAEWQAAPLEQPQQIEGIVDIHVVELCAGLRWNRCVEPIR